MWALGAAYRKLEDPTCAFLLLENLDDQLLTLVALWMFGVYRTSSVQRNLIRRSGGHVRGLRVPHGGAGDDAFSCFQRHAHQAVFGHDRSARVFDFRGVNSGTTTSGGVRPPKRGVFSRELRRVAPKRLPAAPP